MIGNCHRRPLFSRLKHADLGALPSFDLVSGHALTFNSVSFDALPFFFTSRMSATDGGTTGVLDGERRRASFDAGALEEIVNRGRAKAIAKVR